MLGWLNFSISSPLKKSLEKKMAQIQMGRKTRLLDFVSGPCVDPTYTHEIVTARKCALVFFFNSLFSPCMKEVVSPTMEIVFWV
jgi:hypothetical protein